jgi:hypothetical protein
MLRFATTRRGVICAVGRMVRKPGRRQEKWKGKLAQSEP